MKNPIRTTETFIDKGLSSTYVTTKFSLGKNRWAVSVISGRYNYISVRKMNSPWKSLGKRFENWKEVMEYYRNEKMRTVLMEIELGI